MVALLDVNFLIALAWPNHVFHRAALRWFRQHQPLGWATSPLTQSGFVRVSSNERVLSGARTPRESIELLARIIALPHHVFWTDATSVVDARFVARERLVGHRQVTDAHLLALALENGGRLATFDRRIRAVVPPSVDPSGLVLVPST